MAQKKNEKGFCLIPYWYLLKLMSWLWDVSNSIYVRLVLMVNILPANEGDWKDMGSIPALGRSPEKEMTIYSNILAWRIPWTEKPCRQQFTGSQRVRHGQSDRTCMHAWSLMLAYVKINQLLFYILVVTYKAWNHKIFQKFQNFFSWNFQRHLSCSPLYLDFFCPCTWSLCLETCLSSWPPSQTPTSTPPCTSSSPTCPL